MPRPRAPRTSDLFAPPDRDGAVPLFGWEGGPVLRSQGPTQHFASYQQAAIWLSGAGPGHLIWKGATKGRIVVTYSNLHSLRLRDAAGEIGTALRATCR